MSRLNTSVMAPSSVQGTASAINPKLYILTPDSCRIPQLSWNGGIDRLTCQPPTCSVRPLVVATAQPCTCIPPQRGSVDLHACEFASTAGIIAIGYVAGLKLVRNFLHLGADAFSGQCTRGMVARQTFFVLLLMAGVKALNEVGFPCKRIRFDAIVSLGIFVLVRLLVFVVVWLPY